MRRHFLTLLVAIVATTMSLKAQTIVIDDGFENGIQDSIWTQEYVVGHGSWQVESVDDGLNFPGTTRQGSKRAYLRNTSGETQGYVTRLVSKVMDLSPDKVYQPELTFFYANPKWTADRDTLRVLYRTGPKAKWQQLREFSTASANWQKVHLELPEVNETYQIAFEGTDNLGRGIVLDSVKLRSAPICTVPHDISITNLGAGKVSVNWIASWDASRFELILTNDVIIDPDTLSNVADTVIALHVWTKDGLTQSYDATLESGKYYYAYLRSNCDAENSAWNSESEGQYRFRVKATKYVPFTTDFNLSYNGGYVDRDWEWTWGNNTGHYNPLINTHQNETDRAKYSIDGTTCVVFSGANNSTTAVPAGQYAYLASPAIDDTTNANFALNQCRVRFWSTVHTYTGRRYAHSLIVGVMTDPEDITTFVAVDTVTVWGTASFVENTVDLSSYKGNGVYLAFLSYFDTKNLFYLDDVRVEYNSTVQKVTKISVNPRDTYAEISWEGNAPKYNVLITNAEVNPASAPTDKIVDRVDGLTDNHYRCNALEPDHSWNRPYYVYVQAEGTDWSYRYPFVTIASEKAVPYSFDFEQTSGIYYIGDVATTFYPTEIGIFSNDPEYPHLYTTNYYKGSSCLYLSMDPGNDSWITLPPVDSLQNKQVRFYLSANTSPTQGHATLGIMTNPMDINTFIPVSDFTVASSGYTICYANFANYSGPDGIIAIRWSDIEGLAKNTNNYIDELSVEEISKCLPPVNMQVEAKTDTATISWDKSEATTWEMVFAKSRVTDTQRENEFVDIAKLGHVIWADTVVWDDVLNDPKFGFGGLKFNTPYYVYVRTLCGEEKTWWTEFSFTTPCPEKLAIPYSEDFESLATGAYDDGVACWKAMNYGSGTGYPKVLNLTSGAQSGNQLELYSTSTTQRNAVMLPEFASDLSQMALSFTTRSWSTSAKSILYVGSMADINDWTTFVAVDTFYNNDGNTFQHVRMDLADYTFAYDNIVFTSGLTDPSVSMTTSDVMIDDISIKPNSCIDAWRIESTDVQPNSLDITWKGKAENNQWELKVMKEYVKLDSNQIAAYDTAKVAIVNDTIVNSRKFHVEGLQPKTQYYFYVRSLCGDSIWAVDSLKTGCVKLDPSKPNKETFESYPSGTSYKAEQQADCWTVGNGNPSASTTYIPYIYKTSATYAASGTNAYRLYPTATYSPTWVATPEIDCNSLTDLAVTFSFYGAASYYILPGVMTDPEDLSTFVVLDSIKCQAKIVTMTMDLSDYADTIPAGAKYFAWRTAYNAGPTIYLDDVSIIKMNCPLPKPSYSGLTAEQVRISSGLRTDNKWLLLVSDTAAFTADELALMDVDSLVHDSAMVAGGHVIFYDTLAAKLRNQVVKGLKEQTDYYVAVASFCGEEGLSQWQVISFKTPCLAVKPEAMGTITFSKAEGYETGSGKQLPCWKTSNKTTTTSTSYIPYIGTTASYMHNGNNYLYIYSYVPSTATGTSYDGAYAIMPELDVDDISKYQVNFWARGNTGTAATYHNDLIIGVITDPSDLNTFTVIDTLTLSKTGYEFFSVSLEDYLGDYLGNKGRYIMMMTETGSTPGALAYGYAYVSEISVEKIPMCRPVTEFTVDSLAEDAAAISWKQYSDSYRVMLADRAVPDSLKATYKWKIDSVVTKTDSVLIQGLIGGTRYYLYAQALCDGGDSSAISTAYAEFFTNCPEATGYPVPYKQDFEAYATNAKYVDCWQFENYAASTKTYPQVLNPTSGAVSGKQLEIYSTGTTQRSIAVMPKIAGNLSDYMLSFDARSFSVSGKSVLYIGTINDVADSAAGFVPFDTLYMTTGNTFYHKDYVLADYNLAHSHIAFTSGLAETLEMGSDLYLDNVRIGMPPSCFAPALEAGNTTLYTAEVDITPAKAENNLWHLVVLPDSVYTKMEDADIAAYLDTTSNLIVADSLNFVISGLNPGTVYQVYARTACGGEDGNSEWTTRATQVRTKYYYKDGYFFGFERNEGWEFCKNSTSTTYYIHPALEVGYEGGNATTSYTSYYPYCMENTSSGIYAWGDKPASGKADDPWPDGKGAIRWQATATYWGGYLVLPAVEEAHDRSFEFKVRSGYLSYSTMKPSTSYNAHIEIGTIEKYKGFETYEAVATADVDKLDANAVGTAENDWFWDSYTIEVDSATVANKQMVIRLLKADDSSTRYVHFDNVSLGAPKGFGMVSLKKIHAEATTANVEWDNVGGPWNLYITQLNGKKVDTIASYENISAVTSQEITGLTPHSTYTAVLVAANAPANTKFKVRAAKEFKTPCLPLEADAKGEFFWNFNDPAGWERSDVLVGNNTVTDSAYYKPECFTVGTTYASAQSTTSVYYNWLIQRKGYGYTGAPTTKGTTATSTARYEYGRNDSPALRLYMSSSYKTSYLVLPELNCDFDTMMIEFYARQFANYAEDYGDGNASANKIIATTYLGATYGHDIIVGTLTDPSDFSTLEVIDTLTYKQTNLTTANLVNQDPAGLRYWEKMQLPLASAKGKYLVLYVPGDKTTLFFVDDLSVKAVGDNLFAPSGAQTGKVTATTADFSWRVKHPTLQSVVVVMDEEGVNEVLRDTIVGTEYTATGLQPATKYQWFMYQTNGSVNTSTTQHLEFYTECVAITPDYTTGFELEDGWKLIPGQTSVTYKQTMCWVYGNAGTAAWSSSYEGYNQANTASYRYSHSGGYAVRLEAYSTTHQPYIAMPAMDVAAYDTLQINFWMRPGYQYAETYSSKPSQIYYQYTLGSTASSADYYYSKAIIVGTMTDPNDASTFVPIDTVNYSGTFKVGDMATSVNEYLFQKKKVVLTGATGPYIAFMTTLNAKGETRKSTYDYMWLDDISFSAIQHCDAPEAMTASDITASSATLSWNAPEGADKYELQVSTDASFEDATAFVFNGIVNGNSQEVSGLVAHTDYMWRVRTICGEDLGESEFSQNSLFTTQRAPFYLENFSEATLDVDWTFGTNPAALVIDSTDVEITGSNNTTYGFKRITDSYGVAGAHYCIPFYSSTTTSSTTYDYYWMISPVICLNGTQKAHMTVDLALTRVKSGYTPEKEAAAEANMKDDYIFAIAVSEDGGKTWKKENILSAWNNLLPAGNQLRDLPAEAETFRFDLSKFAGKNIRIAFYREAQTYLANGCAVHIGNIRVAHYDEFAEAASACQYQDIEQNGFFIDGDKVKAGNQSFKRFDYATEIEAKAGYLDTIYTLNANIYEAPETILYDTVCGGETYTDQNFTGKSRTGIYRRKMQSVEFCDSIITLHLFVTPVASAEERTSYDTICFGASYTWYGKEYKQKGLYEEKLVSQYGCDSIALLNLFVYDQFAGEEKKELCAGGSITWNGKVYDKAGTYKETLKATCGCDSIATLVLEISDIIHGDPQKETICHGSKFSWNGKVYDKAGVYTDTVQSAFGCDSVNTLELTIAPIIEGTPEVKTICSGNTYTWGGQILSKPGTYKDTLKTVEGCDSVAILTLQIADVIIGAPVNVAICEGASYSWNGKVYDKAGTYKDTLQSAGGCDSVATLVLSVSSILYGEPENVSICEGDSYKWNGNDYTLPGTFVDTVASSFGCDSIITLVLTYYGEEDTIRIDSTITLAQLPFTYENAAYPYAAGQTPISYAEGTELGTYSDTVFVEGKHCTAVMILNLTIDEEHSIGNVGDNNVVLRPNVIRAGESVTAYGNFNGTVLVQVYDVVGRLIAEERNDAKSSISINAFPQSGIYTVRISDSDATQYVGRVLVK